MLRSKVDWQKVERGSSRVITTSPANKEHQLEVTTIDGIGTLEEPREI